MKYCVYTRAFYETPYLDFFIEHYINLGFDMIIILKADSFSYSIPSKFKKHVQLHTVPNLENTLLNKYQHLVTKSVFDWVLSVDVDELLLLHKKYKNIKEYVNEKLLIRKDINTFYFRWGMIEKYDNRELNFNQVLKNYKVFSNSHIKSMVKINTIQSIKHQHIINLINQPIIYFENNILQLNKPNKHPITQNSYNEHILVHMHTRSLNNLILKSIVTLLGKSMKRISKKIQNKNDFIQLINCFDENDCIDKFKECIGLKAILPFSHAQNNVINISNFINEKMDNYYINLKAEKFIIEKELLNNKINIEKYYNFTTHLQNYILLNKFFINN